MTGRWIFLLLILLTLGLTAYMMYMTTHNDEHLKDVGEWIENALLKTYDQLRKLTGYSTMLNKVQSMGQLSSEEIMRRTYVGLEQYLQSLLDSTSYQEYLQQKNIIFPTWQHIWEKCEAWLRKHTFHNMSDTIMDLAHIIPNMDNYRYQLQNALHMHEPFWKQVYNNLVIAKKRLPC
ncbi:hypothetical protein JTE90_016313 [Oedothorax gibbosus]|uniref:Uncharacterized protein n=1 Tax=Oedothorax gibbosus TaxID=931172 RepID=A0AAV6TPJ8_9ARAC|nr:hypothetical protein JTE90_016313 [Oedothorax gibbosus]